MFELFSGLVLQLPMCVLRHRPGTCLVISVLKKDL